MNPSTSQPKQLTDFKHLNLFSTEVKHERGTFPWTFASRKKDPGAKLNAPDAVVIIAVVTDGPEPRLVVTREFRAPLGRHELAPPAGLVDEGEGIAETAKRELREETGLELTRIAHVSPPVASSAGMTDETVSLVYAEAKGVPSREHQTEHESIEIRLLNIAEIRALLTRPGEDIISSRLYPALVGFVANGRIALPSI